MDFKQCKLIFYTYWTKEVISKNPWLSHRIPPVWYGISRCLLWPLRSLVLGLNLKPKHLGFPKDFRNLTEISFTLWILYNHQISSIWHQHYHANTNVVMSWQHNRKHSNCSMIDWLFRVLFFSHMMWLQLLQDAVRRTKFQQELFTNSGRARVLEYSS